MPSVGVFAFILDDDRRVCCVRLTYAHQGWTTPGGRVEPGESPLAALRTEVLEETGYLVEIGQLIGVYFKPLQDDVILSFEAALAGQRSEELSPEIAEVRFFLQEQLPVEMTEVTRQRIEDGFSGSRGIFREFRGPEAEEHHPSWTGT